MQPQAPIETVNLGWGWRALAKVGDKALAVKDYFSPTKAVTQQGKTVTVANDSYGATAYHYAKKTAYATLKLAPFAAAAAPNPATVGLAIAGGVLALSEARQGDKVDVFTAALTLASAGHGVGALYAYGDNCVTPLYGEPAMPSAGNKQCESVASVFDSAAACADPDRFITDPGPKYLGEINCDIPYIFSDIRCNYRHREYCIDGQYFTSGDTCDADGPLHEPCQNVWGNFPDRNGVNNPLSSEADIVNRGFKRNLWTSTNIYYSRVDGQMPSSYGQKLCAAIQYQCNQFRAPSACSPGQSRLVPTSTVEKSKQCFTPRTDCTGNTIADVEGCVPVDCDTVYTARKEGAITYTSDGVYFTTPLAGPIGQTTVKFCGVVNGQARWIEGATTNVVERTLSDGVAYLAPGRVFGSRITRVNYSPNPQADCTRVTLACNPRHLKPCPQTRCATSRLHCQVDGCRPVSTIQAAHEGKATLWSERWA